MGQEKARMEGMGLKEEEVFHLARLALRGRPQDIQLHIRRMAKACRSGSPELAERLTGLLKGSLSRSSPLRGGNGSAPPLPFDTDSRLELVRFEPAVALDVEPIYGQGVLEALTQIVEERRSSERLDAMGLLPTRSALFVGPPGVGKTLAARWIARELDLPLLVLDLSAVMSSFLGRTGTNVRQVLDYAKGAECVLLFDEFDAIAKRRDDATEIGELKRLVTVLLQEIDDWPSEGLLIAATNHAELLDPAVWRRFDMSVDFPMPTDAAVDSAVEQFLGRDPNIEESWRKALAVALRGSSFSDLERTAMRLRRAAALNGEAASALFVNEVRRALEPRSRSERAEVAQLYTQMGLYSQRLVHELTGVSREKIRKDAREGGSDG
jgi:MoxR-like ATPase